jgi:hypothetical protein
MISLPPLAAASCSGVPPSSLRVIGIGPAGEQGFGGFELVFGGGVVERRPAVLVERWVWHRP